MDYLLHMDDGSEMLLHSLLSKAEVESRHYAFPEQRRYPMPDKAHVLYAIRFFNYASPEEEEQLARAILKRIRELGIGKVNVGENNRFRKYYNEAS